MKLGVELKSQVGEPVDPDQLISLPSRGISAVIVCEAPHALPKTTVSCDRGTRVVQALADQFPPDVPLQVCVAGGVKVMPVFPPASPKAVAPEPATVQVAAPVPSISCHSTMLVQTSVPALIVMSEAKVWLLTNIRFTAELALIVRVPLTVCVAPNAQKFVLAAVPVLVRAV